MGNAATNRQFFLWIMLGLLAWAVWVAVGTYLGPEFWATPTATSTSEEAPATAVAANKPKSLTRSFDYRKPLIVLGFVGLFAGGWGLLLWNRQQRLDRAAPPPP
ncbi:MAG TPA: hypothetical protein VL096_03650 [Pirellulaceae bacterium]|nr:hypothetical protein [Pirellulaceae bacterium]